MHTIEDHYFSLIILDFGDTAGVDESITQDIRESADYHVIAEARYWDKFGTGQFTIWAYQPSGRHREGVSWPRISPGPELNIGGRKEGCLFFLCRRRIGRRRATPTGIWLS